MSMTEERRQKALKALKKAEAIQERGAGRCLICKTKLNHPVKPGRKALFCGPECRIKHEKQYHKVYDAQDHVKAAKRKREMARYHRDNPTVVPRQVNKSRV